VYYCQSLFVPFPAYDFFGLRVRLAISRLARKLHATLTSRKMPNAASDCQHALCALQMQAVKWGCKRGWMRYLRYLRHLSGLNVQHAAAKRTLPQSLLHIIGR
jgi:hypothetical protein